MEANSKEIIAKNVKHLREKHGLTKEALSLSLDFDNSYIGKLEKGLVNITIESLDKIAAFFKINPYELLKSNDIKAQAKRNKLRNKNLKKRLGNNIKKMRNQKNFTQAEISKKLGVDNSYITKVESGLVNITADKITAIADCLEVDAVYLLK